MFFLPCLSLIFASENVNKCAQQMRANTIGNRPFQAIREPPGVNRGDGLRPDGMTRAPWSQGRSLVWDVTVVDTVAQSYVKTTRSTAGKDQAEEFKMQKYRILSDRYHFKPLGFETFGSWGQSAVEIIGQIGRRIGEETGEPRSLSLVLRFSAGMPLPFLVLSNLTKA